MVGRLVENQEVGLLQHETAENDSRRLASRKDVGAFEGVVSAEQHLAQQAAQFLLRGAGIEAVQPFNNREAMRDGLAVILRKISDGNFVSPGNAPGIDRELPIGSLDERVGIADQ